MMHGKFVILRGDKTRRLRIVTGDNGTLVRVHGVNVFAGKLSSESGVYATDYLEVVPTAFLPPVLRALSARVQAHPSPQRHLRILAEAAAARNACAAVTRTRETQAVA